MPKELHDKLRREAIKKGFYYVDKDGNKKLTKRGRAYVYGALRDTGWKPSREK